MQSVGGPQGALGVGVSEQHRELVAADSEDEIVRSAARERARGRLQPIVAMAMALPSLAWLGVLWRSIDALDAPGDRTE